MEVHQHTHTPRKKWTHYFWEFLMLFLAVFCGFMAENFREHKIEHKREIQYMKSLLVDLEKDRNSLKHNIDFGPVSINYNDSLRSILSRFPLEGKEKMIYHYFLLHNTGILFNYNDRTISQLKSSGGYRLIRSQSVSDALSDYDAYMNQSKAFENSGWVTNVINTEVQLLNKIFDINQALPFSDSAILHMHEPDKINYPATLKLISYDHQQITELKNVLAFNRIPDQIKLDRIKTTLQMNLYLDSLAKAEYHLN